MAPGLLQVHGASPSKPVRWVPIFTARFFLGLWTNRNPLRSPLPTLYAEGWHLGTTDVLIDGQNVEIANRLTIIRRPGNPSFTIAPIGSVPSRFFSFQQSSTGNISVMLDTATDVEVVTPTTASTIFLKSATAGQTFFQNLGDTLYMGDGVDLIKYIPGNLNGTIWNWGIAAPTKAPTLVITQTAAAGTVWQANSVFSTMGLIVDNFGNAEQLISVNALGNNTTAFGNSGNGQPAWNQTTGATTTETSGTPVVWINRGPVGIWTPNTFYNNLSVGGTPAAPAFIYDPGTDSIWGNCAPGLAAGTSGSSRPNFFGSAGSTISDGSVKWCNLSTSQSTGVFPAIVQWSANLSTTGGHFDGNTATAVHRIIEPTNIKLPFDPTKQTVYIQESQTTGTTGTGYVSPFVSGTLLGATTQDNQLIWQNLGSATWVASTAYTAWPGSPAVPFSVVKDPNYTPPLGCLLVCIKGGVSGATIPALFWKASTAYSANAVIVDANGFQQSVSVAGTTGAAPPVWNKTFGGTTVDNTITWQNTGNAYGVQTIDGTVTWVCVGLSMAWKVNTIYFLLLSGWMPPGQTDPFAGATIKDSNTNSETVVNSGKSGATVPVWSTVKGGSAGQSDTTDNEATWYNEGAFTANARSWSRGFGYAYSFKARLVNDPVVAGSPGFGATLGSPITPPAPTGSQDGSVSTASPIVQMAVGANAGATITITGAVSPDLQADTVEIFRTADGGATLLWLTDIPMPVGQTTWTFIDFLPDIAATVNGVQFPGLNVLLPAPINHFNDPPPGQSGSTISVGATALLFHMARIWVAAGSDVFASGGSDTNPGNGNTAFPPGNIFHFASPVKRLARHPKGVLVFTTTDLFIIAGGPAVTDFFPLPFVEGLGLLSYNAMDTEGTLSYLFTSDNQFVVLDPSAGVSRTGEAIGDQLLTYNPANVYAAAHIQGALDAAVFLADGSTGWFRVNPFMAPDHGLTGPVWSPKANIVGGVKAVQSVLVAAGSHKLLSGSTGTTATPATDTFIRANSLTLGANWLNFGTTSPQIVTNQVEPNGTSATSPGQAGYSAIIWPSNHSSSLKIITLANVNAVAAVACRMTQSATLNVGADRYSAQITGPLGASVAVLINRVVGGVATQLASGTVTVNSGDTILLSASGRTLTFQVNGVTKITVVDSLPPVGAPGSALMNGIPGFTVGAAANVDCVVSTWTGSYNAALVLARDSSFSTFTDNGSAYQANFTMGSILLANQGQMAQIGFVAADFKKVGTQPRISVLLDELSGTFDDISDYIVGDPPKLLGFGNRNTVFAGRYYLAQSVTGHPPPSAWCRHMQVRVDYGATDQVQNEILNFCIYGSIWQEK